MFKLIVRVVNNLLQNNDVSYIGKQSAIREATSALSQNRNMLKMQGRSQKKLMTQAMSMEDL